MFSIFEAFCGNYTSNIKNPADMTTNSRTGLTTTLNPDTQINTGGLTRYDSASLVRNANADAYSAGGIVAGVNDASLAFLKCAQNGGYITYLKISTDDSGASGVVFRIYIMNSLPTGYADAANFDPTFDESNLNYISYVDLTPAALGSTPNAYEAHIDTIRIPYWVDQAKKLYAILVPQGAYPPVDPSRRFAVTMVLENNIDAGVVA